MKCITSVVVLPPENPRGPGGEVFHPRNPGGKSLWTGLASLVSSICMTSQWRFKLVLLSTPSTLFLSLPSLSLNLIQLRLWSAVSSPRGTGWRLAAKNESWCIMRLQKNNTLNGIEHKHKPLFTEKQRDTHNLVKYWGIIFVLKINLCPHWGLHPTPAAYDSWSSSLAVGVTVIFKVLLDEDDAPNLSARPNA